MRFRLRAALAVPATLVAALVTTLAGPPSYADTGRWAPASRATIHPGVQMYTKDAQCTGNFVFTDRRDRVYVGYAAHCAGTGEATETDGCKARSHPLGTLVRFARGGSVVDDGTTVGRGRLAYSSWLTMQRIGTRSRRVCGYNDFALVRVRWADVAKVNPSVPFWGGPVGLDRDGSSSGETVHSFGASSLRAGASLLGPKQGTSLGSAQGGWTHPVYAVTPGVPGDSGSGFLDESGRALGTLSTIDFTPFAGSNGVGDLYRELTFARRHSGIEGLRLVPGTEPFSPLL